jgi:polyisoprenoid-binding protein YceI
MATSTWQIDPAHTDVAFSAKHMMVTTVRGKFDGVTGSIELDVDDPTAARGEFVIDAASLSSGFDARDNHLRSADFFDVANHPTISFRTTGIEHVRDQDYRVTGDLTIREVTRPITFEVEFLGSYQGLSGARRLGFHGRAKLEREDWGLGWNVALETGGWLVGKTITLEIDVAAEEVVAPAATPERTRRDAQPQAERASAVTAA